MRCDSASLSLSDMVTMSSSLSVGDIGSPSDGVSVGSWWWCSCVVCDPVHSQVSVSVLVEKVRRKKDWTLLSLVAVLPRRCWPVVADVEVAVFKCIVVSQLVCLYHMYSTCDTNKLVDSRQHTWTQQPQHQPPQANDNEGGRRRVREVGPRHVLVLYYFDQVFMGCDVWH